MQEFSVISGTSIAWPTVLLAKIQDSALAPAVALVLRDNFRLNLDISLDEPW